MRKGIIYKAECLVNGKVYIGQTIRGLNRRKHEHKNSSFYKKASDYDVYFHRAIRKHDWDNFEWEILEIDVNEDELNYYEELYITKFDSFNKYNGYNSTSGGDNFKRKRGIDNPRSDSNKYTFYHHSGMIYKNINKYEFSKLSGIVIDSVSNLIKNRNKNIFGWVVNKKYLKPIFTFEHKSGIVEKNITRSEFAKKYGFLNRRLKNIFKSKNSTYKGWKLIK